MYIDILLMIRLRRLEKTLPRLYRYMCYSNENNCETMINLYLHAVCKKKKKKKDDIITRLNKIIKFYFKKYVFSS